jgi:hypothetical protein
MVEIVKGNFGLTPLNTGLNKLLKQLFETTLKNNIGLRGT